MTEQDKQEAVQQRATFQIGEQRYFTDSLDEEAQNYFRNIEIIEAEIQKIKLQLDIAKIAKDSFVGKLESVKDTFEKVPVEESQEAQA